METNITVLEKPKLKNPVLIEGLPGVGNVGRVAAGYLIDELKAKKFAELHSPHFMPFTILHKNVAELLKNEFYYWKNPKGPDLILLIGDCQCGDASSKGHYEIAEKILDFCKELGVKKIFTLGGFGTGEIEEEKDIEVLGATSNEKLVKEYEEYGIDFKSAHSRIGMIIGASGLLLGVGKLKGIEGVCLMGETTGFPILTDPRAAEKILQVLIKILGLKLDLSKLEKKSKEMEQFLKRLESIQEKALKQLMPKKGKGKEKLSYIG